MVGENGFPETPDWSLPITRVWTPPELPSATIATAELDTHGTE